MLAVFLLRRILASLPVLFGVSIITFGLLHASTGSLVPGVDLSSALPDDVERIRHNLGLDLPLHIQYLNWVGGLLHGDLGRSLLDGRPVMETILSRLPLTLQLGVTAMTLGVLVALPLGAIAAIRRGTLVDHALTLVSVAGVSIPSFWLGLLMIVFFSVTLQSWGLPWLPSSGYQSTVGGGSFADRLAHIVMPAVCLSFGYIAIWSRYARSSLIEVLNQDYIRTARAKGMREARVMIVHAFRNAVFPLITLIGLELPRLISGAVIIEIVFSWPGVGRLVLERAFQGDIPVVLGLTTLVSVMVVAGNLLSDVLYGILDPRVVYK
jgi:peptide/nickel transport system permease protein